MPTTVDLLSNTSFETKMEALKQAVVESTPADGFSPVVTVSDKVNGVVNVTIQDKNGKQSFSVKDGINGEGNGDMRVEDFASLNGVNGYVDAAMNALQLNGIAAAQYATKDHVSTEIGKLGELATKDTIVKADLDQSLRTAIDNANTALQSFTETDPTVPEWAKKANKPSYTADEISGLGGLATKSTVAKTDLASGVQTSLGLADTALQSFTETDPTVPEWAKASKKPTYTASEVGAVTTGAVGAANGVASLGEDGKIPSSQLPSFVDDVLEYDTESAFPSSGEAGKIYVDKSTNKTFRWSGTQYVVIGSSLALGTTTGSAFDGANGQAAYTHAVTNKGAAFTSGLYKITTNAEGHVTAATKVSKTDITELGIPAQDTTSLGSMSGTLSIEHGGTGASTKEDAISNLGLGTLATKSSVGKTDLSAGVQSSLALADSALQSITKSMVTTALGYTPLETAPDPQPMTAASASADGAAGLVPKPAAGANTKFLRGDATWQAITASSVGLGNVGNYKAVSVTASQGLTSDEQTAARGNIGLGTAAVKGITDSSSASAISTGTNVTTERDVYYGLPTINGAHNYTSATNYYVATTKGTSGQVLFSNGGNEPYWGTVNAAAQGGTVLSGTLAANSTSLAFTDAAIKNDNTVEYTFYCTIFGVSPSAVTLEEGSMTLTFPAQSENMLVRVKIMPV